MLGLSLGLLAAVTLSSVAALLYLHPRWLISWFGRRHPDVLFAVDTQHFAIALTIDDGPHPKVTPAILEVLRRHEAKATFFVIGERIHGNQELVSRIQAEGHELGNHLHSDQPSILLPDKEFETQLVHVDSLIETGAIKWFRPGSGWFSRGMLRTAAKYGYRCCLASLYPMDTRVRLPRLIHRHVLRGLAPGAILVLHDGSESRFQIVEVLEKILPAIRSRGYRILTVSELVALQAAPAT